LKATKRRRLQARWELSRQCIAEPRGASHDRAT
jgi:hypothetical protein